MNLEQPVRGVMTAKVQTIAPDATLTDAWTLMLNGGFRHLPVAEGGTLIGMLSAADLLAEVKALPGELRDTGYVPDERNVRDLMSRELITVSVDAPLRDAVAHFAAGRIHSVPVVAGSRLVGIVTTADLAQALLRGA